MVSKFGVFQFLLLLNVWSIKIFYQTIYRRVAAYEGPEDFKQDVR